MKCRIAELAGHKDEFGKVVFDWNVSEMCRLIGISRSYFYQIVNSEKMPSVDIALSLCHFLNARENLCYSPGKKKYTVEKLWV